MTSDPSKDIPHLHRSWWVDSEKHPGAYTFGPIPSSGPGETRRSKGDAWADCIVAGTQVGIPPHGWEKNHTKKGWGYRSIGFDAMKRREYAIWKRKGSQLSFDLWRECKWEEWRKEWKEAALKRTELEKAKKEHRYYRRVLHFIKNLFERRGKMTEELEPEEQTSDDQGMADDVKNAIIKIEEWLERRKEKESRLDRQRRISLK